MIVLSGFIARDIARRKSKRKRQSPNFNLGHSNMRAEVSPSSRATCKSCHQKIPKGEWRYKEIKPLLSGVNGSIYGGGTEHFCRQCGLNKIKYYIERLDMIRNHLKRRDVVDH